MNFYVNSDILCKNSFFSNRKSELRKILTNIARVLDLQLKFHTIPTYGLRETNF
ncbi:hypothetical protein ACS0TY_024542 [Phlomoides rotata]